MSWKLFDKAFSLMDDAFAKLRDAMNQANESTLEHSIGTVIHTRTVTKFPDGSVEEPETTTRVSKWL